MQCAVAFAISSPRSRGAFPPFSQLRSIDLGPSRPPIDDVFQFCDRLAQCLGRHSFQFPELILTGARIAACAPARTAAASVGAVPERSKQIALCAPHQIRAFVFRQRAPVVHRHPSDLVAFVQRLLLLVRSGQQSLRRIFVSPPCVAMGRGYFFFHGLVMVVFFPAPRQWGGGTALLRGGRGVAVHGIVGPREQSIASHAPSTTLRVVPLPRFAGADESSRSRDAVAPELCDATKKNPPRNGEGRRSAGRRNPTMAASARCGCALCVSALASRRSTAALAKAVTLRLNPGPRFLELPGANERTLPGASAASTSQTGPSAGRFDARSRPGAKLRASPAGTARAPSQDRL